MKLVQLIYSSRVSGALNLDTIKGILDSANAKNAKDGITGFLAFDHENFIQVIEGGTTNVNQLYKRICKDPRNHGQHLISFRELEERMFSNFSMGDFNLEAIDTSKMERTIGSSQFEPNKLRVKDVLVLLKSLAELRLQEKSKLGI